MTQSVSDSRFHMWRAVIALAHADARIAPEERDFIANYFQHVPFAPEQRAVLERDIERPQEPAAMFDKIIEPADQGEFFQFARMIVWSDGDYDAQEEAIFELVKGTQMGRVDEESLRRMVADTRAASAAQREKEDEAVRQQARNTFKVRAFVPRVFGRKAI